MPQEISFIDAAVTILLHEKKPLDLYTLFDRIIENEDYSEAEKADLISKFYTDLTTSAKFVYVGDNAWNLKANEKVELWEKDGSFYKEYNVVELPEEYKKEEYVAAKKQKPAVKHTTPEPQEEVVVEQPQEEIVVETKQEPIVEPVVEPAVTKPIKVDTPDEEEYDEEVFEDYEDFDEEKYNEYMDTYEDQYDD